MTGGPIFAGPSMSHVLPSQVFFFLCGKFYVLIHVNHLLPKYIYNPSLLTTRLFFLQVLVCCRNGSVYSLEPVLFYFLWTLIYFTCCCLLLLLGALFLSSAKDFNSKQVQLYLAIFHKDIDRDVHEC